MAKYKVFFDGEEDDEAADNLVNNNDAIILKFGTYLVNQPWKSIPPKQCAAHDADIANGHLYRVVGYDESQLGKNSHEEQDNQWIGECH